MRCHRRQRCSSHHTSRWPVLCRPRRARVRGAEPPELDQQLACQRHPHQADDGACSVLVSSLNSTRCRAPISVHVVAVIALLTRKGVRETFPAQHIGAVNVTAGRVTRGIVAVVDRARPEQTTNPWDRRLSIGAARDSVEKTPGRADADRGGPVRVRRVLCPGSGIAGLAGVIRVIVTALLALAGNGYGRLSTMVRASLVRNR